MESSQSIPVTPTSKSSNISLSEVWNIQELYVNSTTNSLVGIQDIVCTTTTPLQTESYLPASQNDLDGTAKSNAKLFEEIVFLKSQVAERDELIQKLKKCPALDECPHSKQISEMARKIQRLEKLIENLENKEQLPNNRVFDMSFINHKPSAVPYKPTKGLFYESSSFGNNNSNKLQGMVTSPLARDLLNSIPSWKNSTGSLNRSAEQVISSSAVSSNANNNKSLLISPNSFKKNLNAEIENYRRKRIISSPNAQTLLKIQNCYNAMRQ